MGGRKHARTHDRTHEMRHVRYIVGSVPLVTRSAGVSSAPEIPSLIRAVLPCEIRIVDEEKREIEVCATSEAVDSYGTVFGYDASKDAFGRWAGNVREMHDRKAVGRKVAVRYDDDARRVYARVRISKGAEDTWEKVKDGTLAGASIGASDVTWQNQRVGGNDVPVATHYDLVELSLVDLPSNPDALGVTFVRDGVPDAALLDDLEVGSDSTAAADGTNMAGVGIADGASVQPSAGGEPDAPTSQPAFPADQSQQQAQLSEREASAEPSIVERDGSLSSEDPAAAIAAAALQRGQREVAVGSGSAPSPDELTPKQRRLAALGAPGYVQQAAPDVTRTPAASPAPGESATGYGVDQPFDIDGDHENPDDYVTIQSGPTAGAVMSPSPAGSVAHMVHNHHHRGGYSDPSDHRESSGHQHLDGTSHTHEHVMDHDHGGHDGFPQGHAHPHGHVPDHGHHYRVADGTPIDTRLVTGEQVRTHEYVSAEAFRAAAGIEGTPLTADQYRTAAAAELRLIDERALGPYSRNPRGPADAGTPDEAPGASSMDMQQSPDGNAGSPALDQVNLEDELRRTGHCPLCHGQVRALDRDGNPEPSGDANGHGDWNVPSTGHSNNSVEADGWDGRTVVAEITPSLAPQYAALAGSLAEVQTRLARIEQTPLQSGPVLRAADRGSAFSANGYAGRPDANAQYAALESLAGKLADPQAQVAVAAEMIRLQQEAQGMAPAMQVMPRAGQGWGTAGQ